MTRLINTQPDETNNLTDEIVRTSVRRFKDDELQDYEDFVAREYPLTIILNDQELVTLLCTPSKLKQLAVGFLYSEGLLQSGDEIRNLTVDEPRGIARVSTDTGQVDSETMHKRFITSGCGRGASFYNATDITGEKVTSDLRVKTGDILSLVRDFQHHSEIYRATGGVHSAALCDNENILLFTEDIGRHNALDKIFGECMLDDISVDDKIIVSSGRISSEMLLKVARRKVPVIVSKSAPTDLGIKLANDLGITLIGYVRGKRMNVYTENWRVV